MALVFPPGVVTDDQKNEYTRRYDYRMLLSQNFIARWFNIGLSQAEYDNGVPENLLDPRSQETTLFTITDRLKTEGNFPFVAQLSQADYDRFRAVHFETDRNHYLETSAVIRVVFRGKKNFEMDIDNKIFFQDVDHIDINA